jgi:hypothetical protein
MQNGPIRWTDEAVKIPVSFVRKLVARSLVCVREAEFPRGARADSPRINPVAYGRRLTSLRW